MAHPFLRGMKGEEVVFLSSLYLGVCGFVNFFDVKTLL